MPRRMGIPSHDPTDAALDMAQHRPSTRSVASRSCARSDTTTPLEKPDCARVLPEHGNYPLCGHRTATTHGSRRIIASQLHMHENDCQDRLQIILIYKRFSLEEPGEMRCSSPLIDEMMKCTSFKEEEIFLIQDRITDSSRFAPRYT